MISIPWKYVCILLVMFVVYGPDLKSVDVHKYAKMYIEGCNSHENKTECIIEQVKSLLQLANATYNTIVTNFTKTLNEIGIKERVEEAIMEYFSTKEKVPGDIYPHPSPEPKEKVNVSSEISRLLDRMQAEFKQSDVAKQVKERIKTIAIRKHSRGYCTIKIGADPLIVQGLIDNIAKMTNMPRHLQDSLETAIKVKNGDSSMVKEEQFAYSGKLLTVLIASNRNANNSLDVGLAVYYADYHISPKGYQEGADQETLQRLIRFLKHDTDNATGEITDEATEDLKAYFAGEAFHMFMTQCPALLTGFKKVQNDVNSND